jgi:hypothetical protein
MAKVPKPLRRLLAVLTEEDKLRKYRRAFEREPSSEEELEAFIEMLAVELYNSGWDAWPEDDDEIG